MVLLCKPQLVVPSCLIFVLNVATIDHDVKIWMYSSILELF
jgi:hypothetical protein